MPNAMPSVEDRFAISDLLMSYAYTNDIGDAEGMVALFTKDALLEQPAHGKRFEGREGIRKFASGDANAAGRAGRQHHYQTVQIKPRGDGFIVRSYWFVVHATLKTNTRFVRSMGYYDDHVVKVDGAWLIKHKRICPWNDETTPPPPL